MLRQMPSKNNNGRPVNRRATKRTTIETKSVLKNHKRKKDREVQSLNLDDTDEPIEDRWERMVQEARDTGHFMFLIFSMNGSQTKMYRRTSGFPPSEFDMAIDLLEDELSKERKLIQEDDFFPVVGTLEDEGSTSV